MLGLRGRTGAHALGQPGGAFSGLAEAVKTLVDARGRSVDANADRAERRGLLREKISADLEARRGQRPDLVPAYLLKHAGQDQYEVPREQEERNRILLQAGFDPQSMRQIDPERQQQLLEAMEQNTAPDDGLTPEERQRFANRRAALEQRAMAEGAGEQPDEAGPSTAAEFMQSMAQQQTSAMPPAPQAQAMAPAAPPPPAAAPVDQGPTNAEQFMRSLPVQQAPAPAPGPVAPAAPQTPAAPAPPPWSTGGSALLDQVPPQFGGGAPAGGAVAAIEVGGQSVPIPPEAAAVIQQPEFASRIERARRVGRADLVQAIIERAMNAR